jgi:hypothetical protein
VAPLLAENDTEDDSPVLAEVDEENNSMAAKAAAQSSQGGSKPGRSLTPRWP